METIVHPKYSTSLMKSVFDNNDLDTAMTVLASQVKNQNISSFTCKWKIINA